MSKFKPGDLAMIVACRLPDLIGKTVELVLPVCPGEEAGHGGRKWMNTSSQLGWVVAGEGLYVLTVSGRVELDRFTLMPEHKLMPLGGDLLPEKRRSREVAA